MWNIAFSLTIVSGGANAFKAYYAIRSFITFHGIFMASGYDSGAESIWRTAKQEEEQLVEEDEEEEDSLWPSDEQQIQRQREIMIDYSSSSGGGGGTRN